MEDIEELADRIKLLRKDIATSGSETIPSTSFKSSRERADVETDSFVPGLNTVYVKTWGCSHNSSDSEYMAGLLSAAGYRITDKEVEGDVWLLNSCTVKTPSEMHLQNKIKAAIAAGKKVVVGGCVSQAAPNTDWLKGLSLIGVQQIDRIVEVVEETLMGNSVKLLGVKRADGKRLGGASLMLPKVRRNPLIEILPINTGCLNHCTYCKTKYARGNLASYCIEELVQRARHSFTEGVKEIWLTSEDLGAYGHDLDVRLPDLLKELVKVIPEGCVMRLGMTNPPYILDHLKDIADILNHPRVYAFLHIPVQAGSNRVLDDMRREYTVQDFEKVVDFMLERVPGVTIATDVICGFPTENAEDFDETMALVKKYKFPSLFINQFFPRSGTPAAKMKRVNTAEVKRRTKALSELFHSYHPYSDRVGKVYDALITEVASDDVHFVAHNKFYEQILVPKRANLMGQFVRVRISSVTKFSMIAEIVSDSWLSQMQSVPRMVYQRFQSELCNSAENLKSVYVLLTVFVALFCICMRIALFS